MTTKKWGAIRWKNCTEIEKQLLSEWSELWVHRNSWLKAQFCAILEPNTNVQKCLCCHINCAQLWAHLGAIATASCAVSNRARYPHMRRVCGWERAFKDAVPIFSGLGMNLNQTGKWSVWNYMWQYPRSHQEKKGKICYHPTLLNYQDIKKFIIKLHVYKPQDCQRRKRCCWNIHVATLEYTLSRAYGLIYTSSDFPTFNRYRCV